MITTLCLCGPMPETPTFTPEVANKEHTGHAVTELRTDVGWVGPSQTFHVIVSITPDDDWHVYWKNSGASGAPTEFETNAPDGFIVGEPIFPRPTIFHEPEGATYGYRKKASIFIPITAPETLTDGQIEISIQTHWLACNSICIMGEQTKTLRVSTNTLRKGPPNKDAQLVQWKKALPKPLGTLQDGKCYVVGSTLYVSGVTEFRPIQFIGIERNGVRFDSPSRLILPQSTFQFPISIDLDFYATETKTKTINIEGLLLLGSNSDDPSYVVKTEVDIAINQHKSKGN